METTLAEILERAESWPKEARDELIRVAEEIEKEQSAARDWQAGRIEAALKDMQSGGEPDIAHDDVAKWLASWGKPNELKPPVKTKR